MTPEDPTPWIAAGRRAMAAGMEWPANGQLPVLVNDHRSGWRALHRQAEDIREAVAVGWEIVPDFRDVRARGHLLEEVRRVYRWPHASPQRVYDHPESPGGEGPHRVAPCAYFWRIWTADVSVWTFFEADTEIGVLLRALEAMATGTTELCRVPAYPAALEAAKR